MDFDWKKTLSSIAPTLATALGGPMAGAATKFLAGSLLDDEAANEAELESYVLSANPDQLAHIKEIDSQFKLQMEQLEVDVFKLETTDRQDARNLAKGDVRPQLILSAVFIIGYFSIVLSLLSGLIEIPEKQTQLLTMLIGVLTAAITGIIQFWFGSSHGSKSKDNKKE